MERSTFFASIYGFIEKRSNLEFHGIKLENAKELEILYRIGKQ
jgi:hypothetical protein